MDHWLSETDSSVSPVSQAEEGKGSKKKKKTTEKEKKLQVELVASAPIFHNQMFSQKVYDASDLDSVSLQHLGGRLESLRHREICPSR